MRESEIKGRTLYFCEECGLGYADKEIAQRCEEWCSAYKSCSLEITKNAVYKAIIQENVVNTKHSNK